jgi:hypothetical protein
MSEMYVIENFVTQRKTEYGSSKSLIRNSAITMEPWVLPLTSSPHRLSPPNSEYPYLFYFPDTFAFPKNTAEVVSPAKHCKNGYISLFQPHGKPTTSTTFNFPTTLTTDPSGLAV